MSGHPHADLMAKAAEIGIPEPVREPLKIGQEYWVAEIARSAEQWLWDDDERDWFWLERGLIHLTEEAAEAHIAALLSFTQK